MVNEKRLIDLDANLKRLEKESWWRDEVKSCIRMFLAKAKLVDAVEVMRCKDCKHSYDGVANLMCGRCGQNINGIRLGGVSVKEEHFCSYGERRDEE